LAGLEKADPVPAAAAEPDLAGPPDAGHVDAGHLPTSVTPAQTRLPQVASIHAVGSIGHEFIGVVEETGADVGTVAPGDLVIAPFF
jgi:hypothetical protein